MAKFILNKKDYIQITRTDHGFIMETHVKESVDIKRISDKELEVLNEFKKESNKPVDWF